MIQNSKILMIVLPLTLILLGYAAYDYGYPGLQSSIQEAQDFREQKEKMLYKYVAAISNKQHITSTLSFLRPMKAANDQGMIGEPDPLKASQTLSASLKEIIIQGGGQFVNEKGYQPVKSGTYKMILADIEAILPDARALNDIVYAIEAHRLYMVIREMDVNVTNPNNPRELAVKFKIAALGVGK
jgi:hypothetical protein